MTQISSEYLLSFQSSHCHLTLLPSPTSAPPLFHLHSSRPSDISTFVLFTHRIGIRRLSLDTPELISVPLPVYNLSVAGGLAWDLPSNSLFWADKSIYVANLNVRGVGCVVNLNVRGVGGVVRALIHLTGTLHAVAFRYFGHVVMCTSP